MIDPITEDILVEAKIIDSMKKIVPMAKQALMKGDVKLMKRIASRLPQKTFKEVEKEAMRKLPGFRNKLKEAQRFALKSREAKGLEEPLAIAGAIVATITQTKTKDVMSKFSDVARDAQKLILFPGDIKVLKLILFIIAIALIYFTKGAVILPAIQYTFAGAALLMALLGKLLSGAASMIEIGRDKGPEAMEAMKNAMQDMDIPGTAGMYFPG